MENREKYTSHGPKQTPLKFQEAVLQEHGEQEAWKLLLPVKVGFLLTDKSPPLPVMA